VWAHLDRRGPKPEWKDGLYDDPHRGIEELARILTEGVVEMIERLGARIITLHICDNTRPKEEHTCWPMSPGEGLIDWAPALRALRRADYRGPAMYEVYAPPRDCVQALKRLEDNYAQLREMWDTS